jgi:hypothetical protein
VGAVTDWDAARAPTPTPAAGAAPATSQSGAATSPSGETTSASGAATSPARSPAAKPLSAAQLKKALLTARDLPAGFTSKYTSPRSGDGGGSTKVRSGDAACAKMIKLLDQLTSGKDPRQAAGAGTSLVSPDPKGTKILEQTLASYPAGQAEKSYAALTEATTGCRKYVVDVLGEPVTYTRAQSPAGSYGGDASQADAFTATTKTGTYETQQVLVRTGGTLVFVGIATFGGQISPALTKQAVGKALAKLDGLARQ